MRPRTVGPLDEDGLKHGGKGRMEAALSVWGAKARTYSGSHGIAGEIPVKNAGEIPIRV
jgi:hypothetical protein